jgi:hypothetical protein
MGKRLVPVSGSFRLPVLPSVEWEWTWRAAAQQVGQCEQEATLHHEQPSENSARARPARDRLWQTGKASAEPGQPRLARSPPRAAAMMLLRSRRF